MHYGDVPPHIADGLIELRRRIDEANIPDSALDVCLNVATWNIREFGRKSRLDPSIYYIAEILNQFDLIALTELRDDLSDLKRVMDLLGPEWRVVFSDFMGDRGGNSERIAYLYDGRMVHFTGLAAEADPMRKKKDGEYVAEFSWWRAPYMASFRAGNFDFVAVTAHMRWGTNFADRVNALGEFGKWVHKRRRHKHVVDSDFVVLGDFNIPKRGDEAFNALTGKGKKLLVPDKLLGVKGTNLSKKNTYDQILHSPTNTDRFSSAGGVLDFYQGDWKPLYPSASHRPANNKAFTYELSDHLPLWLQVKTDIMDRRLQMFSRKK